MNLVLAAESLEESVVAPSAVLALADPWTELETGERETPAWALAMELRKELQKRPSFEPELVRLVLVALKDYRGSSAPEREEGALFVEESLSYRSCCFRG